MENTKEKSRAHQDLEHEADRHEIVKKHVQSVLDRFQPGDSLIVAYSSKDTPNKNEMVLNASTDAAGEIAAELIAQTGYPLLLTLAKVAGKREEIEKSRNPQQPVPMAKGGEA